MYRGEGERPSNTNVQISIMTNELEHGKISREGVSCEAA